MDLTFEQKMWYEDSIQTIVVSGTWYKAPLRDVGGIICTCLSAGVINLQDLYNQQDLYDLPESNMCDLCDLFTGMGYVRSAFYYAHFIGGSA